MGLELKDPKMSEEEYEKSLHWRERRTSGVRFTGSVPARSTG